MKLTLWRTFKISVLVLCQRSVCAVFMAVHVWKQCLYLARHFFAFHHTFPIAVNLHMEDFSDGISCRTLIEQFVEIVEWTLGEHNIVLGWVVILLPCYSLLQKKKNFLWISPLSDVSFYFCMPVFVKWIFQLFVWFVTFCRIHFERELWW